MNHVLRVLGKQNVLHIFARVVYHFCVLVFFLFFFEFADQTWEENRSQKDVLTLHLVTVGGLSRLRCGEARAVAQEACLSRGLGLAQTPLGLYACPQWT